jgi:hypothetical protein
MPLVSHCITLAFTYCTVLGWDSLLLEMIKGYIAKIHACNYPTKDISALTQAPTAHVVAPITYTCSRKEVKCLRVKPWPPRHHSR